MVRTKKMVTLSEEDLCFIEKFKNEHGMNSSQVISFLIRNYKDTQSEERLAELISDKTMEKFSNLYKKKYLDPIRIRTGYIDKNSQILLDLINSIITYFNIDYYSAVDAPAYTTKQSIDNVNERISNLKQIKNNKEN